MIPRRFPLLLLPGVLALTGLSAGTADAATTVGRTTAATQTCDTGFFVVPTSGPDIISRSGLLTSATLTTSATGGSVSIKVIRGATIVGASPAIPATFAGANTASDLRIPVQPGDTLAVYIISAAQCGSVGNDSANTASLSSDPAVGTAPTAAPSGGSGNLAISGSIEADADGDGYGDETQDSCPALATIHSGPCQADVAISTTLLNPTVGIGDLAVLRTTVTSSAGQDVTVTAIPSAGVTLEGTGSVTVAVPAGGSATVLHVVQVTTAGAHAVTVSASGTTADPTPANNLTQVTVTAEQRVALHCTVPSVVGLPKSFASTLLKANHCALGKVTTTKKGTKAKNVVTAQAKKKGSTLAAGTKINLTVHK